MIAKIDVKDANGKKHTLELLCGEDEQPTVLLERVSGSLLGWAEAGTIKAKGPFALLKCEVRHVE